MPQPKLIIYGNGQMARMFLDFARDAFEVAAFTVDRNVLKETTLDALPVLPFDEIETKLSPANHYMITAVGFTEMNGLRARKYQEGLKKGYRFANYVHSSVVLHPSVQMGENNVVLDHVALHPHSRLGNSIFICSNVSIGHGCTIGDNNWLNSGVAIGGETIVDEGCFFGMNSTVGDNIHVNRQCYIGANTLVSRNTSAEEVYISPNGERFPLPSRHFLDFISR